MRIPLEGCIMPCDAVRRPQKFLASDRRPLRHTGAKIAACLLTAQILSIRLTLDE